MSNDNAATSMNAAAIKNTAKKHGLNKDELSSILTDYKSNLRVERKQRQTVLSFYEDIEDLDMLVEFVGKFKNSRFAMLELVKSFNSICLKSNGFPKPIAKQRTIQSLTIPIEFDELFKDVKADWPDGAQVLKFHYFIINLIKLWNENDLGEPTL